jgi:hypothetical protein
MRVYFLRFDYQGYMGKLCDLCLGGFLLGLRLGLCGGLYVGYGE